MIFWNNPNEVSFYFLSHVFIYSQNLNFGQLQKKKKKSSNLYIIMVTYS